jgi:hypothetical protein
MSYPRTAPLKVGDTFGLSCTYKLEGVPTPVTNFTLRSQIRTEAGKLIATLEATKADQAVQPGGFNLTLASGATTQAWPAPEDLYIDIEVTDSGVVRSTETFVIPTETDVTR